MALHDPTRSQGFSIHVCVCIYIYMGVSENLGVPYFGILIVRILLFRVLY